MWLFHDGRRTRALPGLWLFHDGRRTGALPGLWLFHDGKRASALRGIELVEAVALRARLARSFGTDDGKPPRPPLVFANDADTQLFFQRVHRRRISFGQGQARDEINHLDDRSGRVSVLFDATEAMQILVEYPPVIEQHG